MTNRYDNQTKSLQELRTHLNSFDNISKEYRKSIERAEYKKKQAVKNQIEIQINPILSKLKIFKSVSMMLSFLVLPTCLLCGLCELFGASDPIYGLSIVLPTLSILVISFIGFLWTSRRIKHFESKIVTAERL